MSYPHLRDALIRLGFALCLLVQLHSASADETGTAAYVLPETEVWDVEAAHGETYRIYVSLPPGEPPEGGFPVLFVLDGNAMFAGFAEARRILGTYDDGLEKIIIVGVGYPSQELYDGRRLGDFTPPIQKEILKALYKDYPSGKRQQFKAFLLTELRPEISRRYPVNELRVSLYGHSLGGLFALHINYSEPGAFHTILAASPTIWWDDQSILGEERAFRARLEDNPSLGHRVRIKVLVGELEEARVTVDDSIALASRLQDLSIFGVRSRFFLLDGETHVTVPSRSVTTALRAAMEWP